MLAMPVGRSAREHGDEDLGPEAADDVEDVLEKRVARPEAERFVGGLREAEVVGAREILPRAVQVARGEQLLGANDAKAGPELRADEILPAFTAREREIRGLGAEAARQKHEELRVFVVGVGADHEDALVRAQLLENPGQRRDAAGAGWGHLPHPGSDGADTKEEDESERASHYWVERYTVPPFITNLTCWSSVISRSGSPASSWPSNAAATDVPD